MAAFKSAETITDPLDFKSSSVPKLCELDSLLRCHICKEFMVAPMLTSCGHSFCSVCIRKYLIHTAQCPMCSQELRESHLTRNVLVEELVISFKEVRSDLLAALISRKSPGKQRSGQAIPPESRGDRTENEVIDVDELGDISDFDEEVQIIEEHTKKRKQTPTESRGIDQLFKKIKKDQPKDKGPTGTCPVCNKALPLTVLQSTHIDICLAGEEDPAAIDEATPLSPSLEPPSRPESSPSVASVSTFFSRKEPKPQYQKLTKLDYSSLSNSALKAKLAKIELPTNGTRHQLESRYNEYLILWNANCDSLNPKNPKVLRKQLAQWESSLQFKTKSDKQLDKDGWRDLIAQARQSAQNAKKRTDKEEEKIEHNITTSEEEQSVDIIEDSSTEVAGRDTIGTESIEATEATKDVHDKDGDDEESEEESRFFEG